MRTPVAAVILLALTGAACPGPDEMPARDRRSTDLPRPRPGDVAIAQELAAARRAGTVAAYDLFLARHGDHRLAVEARRERARVARAIPKSVP